VDSDFENLIKLQYLDSEIQKISLFLQNIPFQLEEIDKKTEESSQIVLQAKEKLSQNQKKRRNLETQAQDIKGQISKYKRQLNEVKTNKEYSFLLKEIEEAQKKMDQLEEEIISDMLLADDIEKEIKEATRKAEITNEKYSKEKETLQQRSKEEEGKKTKLLKNKERLLPKIPPIQVSLYLKIYNNKNGIALSPVRDEFCSMCHMRIRPQMLNELKSENELILCENCGRILYWQEEKEKSA